MNRINICILISLFSLLLIQCNDTDELYKKFSNEEEKIYLGKTDSLIALSGIGRIQLKWYVNADPKIDETVIYWNARQDSVVKSFHRIEKGIQADSLVINDLPEGVYTFELINRNKSSYHSLISSVQGEVYGESFISGLKNRTISSMNIVAYDKDKQLSDIKITWGPNISESLGSKISYYDQSIDKYVEFFVPLNSTSTTITNVGNRLNHPADMLEVSTLYFFENTIDTLETLSRKEQTCVYTATGVCSEYNSDGSITGTVLYGDLIKTLRRIPSLSGDVYECDRVANSPVSPNSLFRFTMQDNNINIDGFHDGHTIIDIGPNTFSPEEQKLSLQYRYHKSNGEYFIVDEKYLPPNTNIPLPLEKQPPTNVYDATGMTVKNLFTFHNDLVVIEPYVGGGTMRFYQYDSVDNIFSGYRGTPWAGWDIFIWSISYTDAILTCTPSGDLTWYSWDRNSGNVIANLGILGNGFHTFDKVISSIDHNGLFCVTNDGMMTFFPIVGVKSLGTAIEMNSDWNIFTHILSYGSDILAIDSNGDMWLFPIDAQKNVGEKKKIGSGWDKYYHITAFGSDLLALGSNGIVWKYKFDKNRFWDVTYN
jgi:hypothetical protein